MLDIMVLIGVQGWSNVDCVTVWLPATNWNCTISPGFALMLSGVYTRELLAVETVTTWTFCAVVEALVTPLSSRMQRARQRTRGDAGHHGKSCCCELHLECGGVVFFFVIWYNEGMGEVNSARNLVLSSVLLSGSRCCRR